jgi:hypothetical protein
MDCLIGCVIVFGFLFWIDEIFEFTFLFSKLISILCLQANKVGVDQKSFLFVYDLRKKEKSFLLIFRL